MDSLSDRIKLRMNELGNISEEAVVARMEKQSGVIMSQPGFHKIKKGGTKQPRSILAIAKALECNPEWLSTGQGPKLRAGSGSLMSIEQTVNESKPNYDNIALGPEFKKRLPILTWIQAGDFCDNSESFGEDAELSDLTCPVTHSEKTYILIVKGPSMEPEYRDGDYIFVDPLKQPEHNSDVVVRLENSQTATFKRLQIIEDSQYLIPINKAWPEPVIPIDEQAMICGVVIFSGQCK